MLWLRQTAPHLLDDRNIYVGAGEYVFFRLTGQWRQDAGSALQIGCYNVPEGRLDAEPLALVDVPLSFVAPLRQGHETHALSAEGAALLHLPPGTPAAGPYMDHEAGYLAAAGISPHPLQCSLGTAWVGNFVLPAGTEWTSPFQLVVPAPGARGAGWQVIQPLLTGNVSWDWGLKTHLPAGADPAAASAGVFAEALLPPDGLVTLPWLNMPSVLWPPALGSGAVFGINASTTPAELLRSLAMGMSCEMLRVMEQPTTLGVFDSVVLGGGASNAPAFQRMLAGLFHPIPTLLLDEQDWAGARGALYAFSPAVARATARPVEPPGEGLRSDTRRAYGRYLDLFGRLCGDYPAGGGVRLLRK
jgi:sugar (pentulose or hexulose) kinase